jgi:hypothetical protein
MIASSTSASTATGGFYASFAMPAPEPPYSHNCAGYYSSRGLGKTMVLSAFIVVLLIGASYRGDPSADGPAKRSAPQTISFAPSAGPGDINKLNKLTSTTKVSIFSGIDGLSFEMLDEMKKLDFKHWEDLRSTLGVSQTTLDRIKQVLHEHLKQEKEKEKAGSEADGWLAASSSSSAANPPTQPEISAQAEGSKKRKKLNNSEFPQWIQDKYATCSHSRQDMKRQYKVC